jgi:hypothetical protein
MILRQNARPTSFVQLRWITGTPGPGISKSAFNSCFGGSYFIGDIERLTTIVELSNNTLLSLLINPIRHGGEYHK